MHSTFQRYKKSYNKKISLPPLSSSSQTPKQTMLFLSPIACLYFQKWFSWENSILLYEDISFFFRCLIPIVLILQVTVQFIMWSPISMAKTSNFLSMDSRIEAIKKHHLLRRPPLLPKEGFAFPIVIWVQIKDMDLVSCGCRLVLNMQLEPHYSKWLKMSSWTEARTKVIKITDSEHQQIHWNTAGFKLKLICEILNHIPFARY